MGWFGKKREPRDANEMLRQYNEEQAARVARMLRGDVPAAGPDASAGTLPPTVPVAEVVAEFEIEDVFTITGIGLVATGTAQTGTLRVGDRVMPLRGGIEQGGERITGIEMFRKKADEVPAGTMAGLLLKGVTDVTRGDVLRVVPAAGA